jgi:amino acid adenylation domain-containing protein
MSHPNKEQAEKLLSELLRDSAGMDLRELNPSASFLELGFDSLFLIQFSQKIKQKSGVKISFRQLIESVSTVETLVDYVAAEMPSSSVPAQPSQPNPSHLPPKTEAAAISVAPHTAIVVPAVSETRPMLAAPVPVPTLPPVAPVVSNPSMNFIIPRGSGNLAGIEQLILQQNQLMAMQLQVLQAAATGMVAAGAVPPNLAIAQPVALPTVAPGENSMVPPTTIAHTSAEQTSLPEPTATLTCVTKASSEASTKEIEKKVFERFGPYKPVRKSTGGGLTESQQKHLDQFIARFTAKTKLSRTHAQKYRDVFADPRGVAGYRGIWKSMVYQISVNRSAGSKLWDIDGNEYIDIAMGFGLNLFGQSPDFVTKALQAQLERGVEVGPQSPLAGEVAALLCEFSGLDRATFCNTGSEAVMAAMRIARTVTGKSICVFFNKDYHGNFDEVLLRSAVVGGKRRTSPAAPGVPQVLADNTIVLDYGSEEALRVIEERADEIAAILVEPVQSADPDFQPREFIHSLRELTHKHNIAMVIDEVISGFRAAPGGAQEYFGVRGDMATYGKVLGGGLPIGALAGKKQYMDALDGGTWHYEDSSSPEADMTFFAGTFVRHPLAMVAAHQILQRIKQEGANLQRQLSTRTEILAKEINQFFIEEGFPIRLARFTSLFRFMFPPDLEYADMLYFHLLDRGIFTRGWGDNCFLSTAHTDEDVARIIAAVKSSCLELRAAGFFPDRDSRTATAHASPSATTVSNSLTGKLAEQVNSDDEKKKDYYRLTDAQQEIWLSSQMSELASCAYNEPFYVQFAGPLDQSKLLAALDQVLARHEALKLRFDSSNPLQHLSHDPVYHLNVHDWSKEPPADFRTKSTSLVQSLATTPFDLSHGPLVRIHLVVQSDTQSTLYVSAHHIVCDGWSWNLMLQELGDVYSALTQGNEPLLESPGSFLHEFVELDQTVDEKQSLQYWRNVYAELPEPFELPADHGRPVVKAYDGATLRYEFDPAVVKAIKRFASEKKVSLFSLTFTAFNVLLRRLSGQRDIVITVPTAGQSMLENSHLVGHCVNLLPVRTKLDDNQNFSQLLMSTSSTLLDAYDHQCCTLGSIIRELNVPRDPSRMPLVEVNFNLDRDSKGVHFEGLEVEIAQTAKAAVNFEIFFNLNEHDQGLRLDLDYNRRLFEPSTIELWVRCFEELLADIVRRADVPITQLQLLPRNFAESLRSQSAVVRETWPDARPLHEMFEAIVTDKPTATAVRCKSKRKTYEEVNQFANQIARQLKNNGVQSQQLVGVFLDRNIDLPSCLLGILKAGAAYVPLDPDFPINRLTQMIQESALTHIITLEKLKTQLPNSMAQIICLDSELDSLRKHDPSNLSLPVVPEQLAYVLFTSGSTGTPKGVQIPHRAVTNFLCSMRQEPGIDASDRVAAITTLSFDISVLEIFLPLVVGSELVIVPAETAKDGLALARLLQERDITFFQATPATWRMLLDSGWKGNNRMKGLIGGEALPFDLANALAGTLRELWNMYGPTETTVWSTIWRVPARPTAISIGHPIANTSIFVLDEHRQRIPNGTMGRLYIGGIGLALGYLNQPQLTDEKFIDDPFTPGERLYDTGDLVRYQHDGQLQYISRADNQVKLRGYRIELGDIEHALANHANIRAAVVAIRKTKEEHNSSNFSSNEYLVGYYVSKVGSTDSSELRNWLRSHLPEYMIPTRFMELSELPLTPNLKVDRKKLPDVEVDASKPENTLLGPRNAIERQLLNIWRDILKVNAIGMDENFFELGGHSLLAARLMARIEQVTGKRLPLATLLQAPTVEALAAILREQNTETSWRCIVPIREGGSGLPLFCVHAAGGNVLLYRELANRLSPDRPVYGIQSSALQHGLPKAKTVEAMAAEYVAEIRKLQPHGPYHLAGYCLGGTIAYEIARQLRNDGEEIGVLALLDTHANWSQESLSELAVRAYQRVAFHVKNAYMSGTKGISKFVAEKIREASRRMSRRWDVLRSHIGYRLGWRSVEPVFLLEGIYDRASEAYIPKPLDAHLILFKPKQSYAGNVDMFFGWQRYAQDITLIELPVYPAGMLIEPFVANLASHIERQLTLSEDGLSIPPTVESVPHR